MVRNFTIWCLCLGSLLLFYVGGRLNPVVYLFSVSLTPLPVYLAGRRLGPLAALLLALAVSLLIFSWKPGLETVSENLGFGELLLMGFLLSFLESRGWRADQAIILTVVGLILLSVLFLLGQAYLSGMTAGEIFSQEIRKVTETVSKVLAGGENLPPGTKVLGVTLKQLLAYVASLLPALAVTNTGLVAWINVILARRLLVLFEWDNPEPPLYYWSAPEWLIFPVLALGFLLMVPVDLVFQVSLNLLVVAALLYFCQGVAVVSAWFQRFRVPRLIRCFGYPLMFLHPLFFLVITLGLMDIWLDFRRMHQPQDA